MPEPYDARKPQLFWGIVPGGRVWHAYADNAHQERVDGFDRRETMCGVWRRMSMSKFFGHTPPGRACGECRMSWDEHYNHFVPESSDA
jgi:hypothetical protein